MSNRTQYEAADVRRTGSEELQHLIVPEHERRGREGRQRLVCVWHRDCNGQLACRWLVAQN